MFKFILKQTKKSILLLLIPLTSCQWNSSNQITIKGNNNNSPQNCESKPPALLSSQVQSIQLNNMPKNESINIDKNQSIGYTFIANKNQIINYQLSNSENLCFWIQTPDNQIITTNDLMIKTSGQYLLQIYALKSKKIDLTISLNLPSSVEFIQNHYQKLKEGKYEETWHNLSYRFQTEVANGYTNYLSWWQGEVAEIRVGKINLVEQTENAAIVDIELSYVKKSGRIVNDSKRYVYLVWNNTKNQWEINEKTEKNR
jgi:hypothetical protein